MPYQTVVVAVLVVATATILYFLSKKEPEYSYGGSKKETAYSYGGNNSQSSPPNTSSKDWDRCNDNKCRRKNSKTICTICFDDLTEGIQTLSCQHKFHKKCIIKWLSIRENQNQGCPLCRKRVFLSSDKNSN